jgi:anti-anti-sigma factor
MNIKREKIQNFTVLRIEGRVDTLRSSGLENEISHLFDSGEKNLIFDCKKMNYISSSGLRVFLVAQKKAISLEGKLCLCNLQPGIYEIFRISGFSKLFKIFDTLEAVLENEQ